MLRFASVLCFVLFARKMWVMSLPSLEVYNTNSDLVDVEIYNEDYPDELRALHETQIDHLLEDGRPVDMAGATRNRTLKVTNGSIEYNTGDKVMHISRINSKTLMKMKIDPSLTNHTDTELDANIDGIHQELSLSHGMEKTIARFYAAHLGDFPNGRPIGIKRLSATYTRTWGRRKPGDKAVKIKYYKGRVYHRPDGSRLRQHVLEIEVRPALLDKQHTRINITIGDFKEGRQYMSVAGVEFLFRDDSARYERCKKFPEKCKITYTTTRKRVQIGGSRMPTLVDDLHPSLLGKEYYNPFQRPNEPVDHGEEP